MKIGLLMFLTLSAVNSHLFPENYLITYKYESIVQAIVDKPTLFTSEVLIQAEFELKSYKQQVVAALKNFTYSMYNGKSSKVGIKPKFLAIPKEAKSIELPFAIEYEKNGTVNGIATEADDTVWSVNMKKTIAATLQLNMKQILATGSKTSYAFYSNESTVHGKCNTFYTVFPQTKCRLTITKHNNPVSCEGFKWKNNVNASPSFCEKKLQNPITISSYRNYDVVKQDNGVFIERAKTRNTIIFNPFKGNSDSHSIVANQKLHMIKYEKLIDVKPEKVERLYHKLKVELDVDTELLYGMTKSKNTNEADTILNSTKTLLENVVKQVTHTSFQSSSTVETIQSNVQNLLYHLGIMDGENLERLNRQLKECESKTEMYALFLETLPNIGTHPSHLLIKCLIFDQKAINEFQTRKMLRDLPFYIKYPKKELVEDFLPMTNDVSFAESTRNVAKLAVATIINKVLEDSRDDDAMQNYVDDYIQKFTESENYIDKLTYLGSIINIGSKKTIEFLEKIIIEDKSGDRVNAHLRSIAIWGIKNKYVEDVEHFDKIFWSLLENECEDLQVRFAAMATLMQNPSAGHLMKMHWYMQTVKDEELYKVYYDFLESYADSTLPCFNKLSLRSKKILAITKKPKFKNARSFVQYFDYFNTIFGFGAQFKTVAIGNIDNDKYMTFYHQMGNMNYNQKALYIRVDASENTSKENIHHCTLLDYYKSLFYNIQKNIYKLTIIHYKNDKIVSVVQTNVDDPDFMENIDTRLLAMLNEGPNYDFDQYVSENSFIITDNGMIVKPHISTPFIVQFKQSHQFYGQKTLKLKYTHRENQAIGLSVYNPLANLWQGTQRFTIFNQSFPLDFKADASSIILKHDEGLIYGFNTYVSNNVFLFDDKEGVDTLKDTCPKCKRLEVVTKGDTYAKKMKIWETKFFGFTSTLELFDCEQNTLRTKHIFDKFINDNHNANPFAKFLLALHQFWTYFKILPASERCGVRFAITPEHTQTNITFGEFPMHDQDDKTYKGFKYEMYQNDKVSNWWSCLLHDNNTRSNFKAHCAYHEKNLIYKICIEKSLNYGQEFRHKTRYILTAGYTDNIDQCPKNTSITIDVSQQISQKPTAVNIIHEIITVCNKKTAKIACITDNLLEHNITLDINYKNLPSETLFGISSFINFMKKLFSKYCVNIKEKNTEKGNIKLNLNWKHSDMELISPFQSFAFRSLNYENWNVYDLLPISFHSFITYSFKDIDFCEIGVNHIINFNLEQLWAMSSEWTQIAAHHQNWELYTRNEGYMQYLAFRIISSNEKLDVHFKENVELYFNEELLEQIDNEEYITKDWFDLKVYDLDRIVIVYLKNSKRTIVFDEGFSYSQQMVRVILPNEFFTNDCQLSP